MLRLQVEQAVLARLRVAVTDGLPHDERDVAVPDRVDRGGFFLPECADLDEAIAPAAQIPAACTGAGTGGAEASRRSVRQVVIDAFLGAAGHVEVVMRRTEVAERWHEPSALDGHTVGSLAAHLARSVFTVQRYLAAPPGSGETTTAAGYLIAVLGEDDPVDSELHRGVRKRARDEAAAGPVDLLARFAQARHDLAETLPACDLRRPVSVLDGIVVPLEDYLRTRIVEMVIHLDDLCVSVGTEPPDDLDAAFDIAAAVLVQVAIRRTGPWATLRSLARRERHPPAIRAL